MGDPNFDPCICSTEWAMQRLLSILRTSQQQCNDNECLPPGTQTAPSQDWSIFFVGFLWLMVVALLFVSRPGSMRRPQGPNKRNNDSGGNPPPPDVPPVQ